MPDKSNDSIANAIWESANRLADDLDIVAVNRFTAWVNEHSTSLRAAYVQDVLTLAALALAYITIGPYHVALVWGIMTTACFVCVMIVYRSMVSL